MARINLLPWREELRQARRKRFVLSLAVVSLLAVGAIWVADQYIRSAIDRQLVRNRHLGQKVALLDERIALIGELKRHRRQLAERMRTIQGLQGSRSVSGRVFDQLARALPDGVYFTEASMTGDVLSIRGVAESNHRLADLMRNLDASDGFEASSLTEVKASAAGVEDQAGVFRLSVRQTRLVGSQDLQ